MKKSVEVMKVVVCVLQEIQTRISQIKTELLLLWQICVVRQFADTYIFHAVEKLLVYFIQVRYL